ncbi:MAG: HesA/MoeB/ThiF family protein [Candidatus Hodarchaeales archaeon]
MTSENRYTRLKALQEFGYDVDFDKLRKKRVIIAGIGGLGSVTAEILARCGIGTIILLDMDIIEEVNFNRMGFRSKDLGKTKVEVTKRYLVEEVNPEINVITHHGDICAEEFENEFETLLKESDLLLMGLDNVPSRQYVNLKCVKTKTCFIDAGASRSGLGGYVQFIIPGKTPCYQCMGALVFSKKIIQGKPCTASLPTTMTIIASLQGQFCLNYLLDFGSFPDYMTYNAINNTFETLPVKRDPKCFICSDQIVDSKKEDRDLLKDIEDQSIDSLMKDLEKLGD